MKLLLAITSLLAVGSSLPVADPITIFNRAPTPGTVYTKCASPGTLALAYDDGPYQYTQTLVNTLNAAGAKGTFFFTGTLYGQCMAHSSLTDLDGLSVASSRTNTDVTRFLSLGCIYNQASAVKAAYQGGHQIASHTWTHGHVGSMSSSQLTTEMTKLEQAFVNLFGKKPAYMRPPYLETGGSVQSVMRSLNYTIVTDDVDSQDWNGATVAQSEARFTSAGAGGNGHIPLMHETYATTVNQLTPWLINWAKSNNLKIVTVGEWSPWNE